MQGHCCPLGVGVETGADGVLDAVQDFEMRPVSVKKVEADVVK